MIRTTPCIILTLIFLQLSSIAQEQFSSKIEFNEAQVDKVNGYVVADLNHDGLDDLLICSKDNKTLAWMPNNAGTLGEPIVLDNSTGISLRKENIEVGDINSDGLLDIIYPSQDGLAWKENLGQGSFGEPILVYPDATVFPTRIVFSPNGTTGQTALFCTHEGEMYEYVRNDLNTFDRLFIWDGIANYDATLIADLDGDGFEEIMIEEVPSFGDIRRLERDEQGNLSSSVVDLPIFYGSGNMIAADFNGDGIKDLTVGGTLSGAAGTIQAVFIGTMVNGQVSFTGPIVVSRHNLIYATDMDADTDLDIVLYSVKTPGDEKHKAAWLENDGSGNFDFFDDTGDIIDWNNSSKHGAFQALDRYGDGEKTLVSFNSTQEVIWYDKENGHHYAGDAILEPLYFPNTVDVLDMDGNGYQDILFYNHNRDNLEILLRAENDFTRETVFQASSNILSVVTAVTDVGVLYYLFTENNILVIENVDGLGFQLVEEAPIATDLFLDSFGYIDPIIDDFNGDGQLDIFYLRSPSYFNYMAEVLIKNQQEGSGYSLHTLTSLLSESTGLGPFGFGNILDDETIQIVQARGFDQYCTIYASNSANEWEPLTTLSFPDLSETNYGGSYLSTRMNVGDIDVDGLDDIVIGVEVPGDFLPTDYRSFWFRNLGNGVFAEGTFLISSQTQMMALELIDADEDGDLDCLVRVDEQDMGISENLGGGIFEHPIALENPEAYYSPHNISHSSITDLNSPDMIYGNASIGWIDFNSDCNELTGRLISIDANQSNNFGTLRCTSADLDQDGDLDILCASEDIFWYENMPALPKADFEVSDVCGGHCFRNTSFAFFPDSNVSWDFGDGTTSTEVSPPEKTYALGSYEVELIVCNDIGCDTVTQTIEVNHLPILDIPTEGVVNEAISFANLSQGYSNFTWVFGDDEISTEENPVHTYTLPGTYTIEVFLTDNTQVDCTYIVTEEITISDDTLVDTLTDKDFKVYPNPTKGIVNLSIGNALEAFEIRVHSTNGILVYSGKEMLSNAQISLEQLNAGIYYIELISSEKSIRKKIVLH